MGQPSTLKGRDHRHPGAADDNSCPQLPSTRLPHRGLVLELGDAGVKYFLRPDRGGAAAPFARVLLEERKEKGAP
jgi:hypothetical protein